MSELSIYKVKPSDCAWKVAKKILQNENKDKITTQMIVDKMNELAKLNDCSSVDDFNNKYFSKVGNEFKIQDEVTQPVQSQQPAKSKSQKPFKLFGFLNTKDYSFNPEFLNYPENVEVYQSMGLNLSQTTNIDELNASQKSVANTSKTNLEKTTVKNKQPQVIVSDTRQTRVAPYLADTTQRALINNKGEIIENKYGHLKYDDCPKELLKKVGNTNYQLHESAANAFEEMQAAAKADGVNIFIVSAYRSTKRQVNVFAKKFPNGDINKATEQQIKNRARWSAPAGYSEHHTGLAIDINSTESSFENTKAYKWLQKNADKYGFEMSFVKDNQQGIGFEPWHWRYVGTQEAKEVFKKAKEIA